MRLLVRLEQGGSRIFSSEKVAAASFRWNKVAAASFRRPFCSTTVPAASITASKDLELVVCAPIATSSRSCGARTTRYLLQQYSTAISGSGACIAVEGRSWCAHHALPSTAICPQADVAAHSKAFKCFINNFSVLK